MVIGIGRYWTSTKVKKHFGYDDSHDVFGVHRIGGIIGALWTGILLVMLLGHMVAIKVSRVLLLSVVARQ